MIFKIFVCKRFVKILLLTFFYYFLSSLYYSSHLRDPNFDFWMRFHFIHSHIHFIHSRFLPLFLLLSLSSLYVLSRSSPAPLPNFLCSHTAWWLLLHSPAGARDGEREKKREGKKEGRRDRKERERKQIAKTVRSIFPLLWWFACFWSLFRLFSHTANPAVYWFSFSTIFFHFSIIFQFNFIFRIYVSIIPISSKSINFKISCLESFSF